MPAAGATETTSDVLSQAPRPKESWEGIIAKDDRSLYRKRAAYGPIGLMGKIELADAKARLSALVDDAQYRRRKTLITCTVCHDNIHAGRLTATSPK